MTRKDPTFNQLLGINNEGRIAGYFGSGAANHPNKGYTIHLALWARQLRQRELPRIDPRPRSPGLNNKNMRVGFSADSNNLNMVNNNFGFVEHNGVFTNVVDPHGKGAAPGGMTIEQLLGVNDHRQGSWLLDGRKGQRPWLHLRR